MEKRSNYTASSVSGHKDLDGALTLQFADVFFPPGQLPSALLIRSLLIRAGDVESNPGPSDRVRCKPCGRNIRVNQVHLTCTGCGAASHKQESCSGVKRAALASSSWRCCECGAPRIINKQPPTNNTILVGQIVGAQNNAGPAVSMKRCLVCARVVRATTQPLICAGCQRDCHKSFSKLSRVEQVMHLASGTWKCDICNNAQTNNGYVNTGQPHDNAVRRAEVRSRSNLKVLQWNANGLKSKMVELEDRIRHTEIDLIMIQESKLCSKDRNTSLPGYSTIRKDR